jgi:hypothetical protein
MYWLFDLEGMPELSKKLTIALRLSRVLIDFPSHFFSHFLSPANLPPFPSHVTLLDHLLIFLSA